MYRKLRNIHLAVSYGVGGWAGGMLSVVWDKHHPNWALPSAMFVGFLVTLASITFFRFFAVE